jgi:hypothetical protein
LHIREQSVLMFAGVVDQDIYSSMSREDMFDGILPRRWLRDIEVEALTTARKLLRQFFGALSASMDAEPDGIFGRLIEECTGDRPAKTAVGAGDKNNAGTHSMN